LGRSRRRTATKDSPYREAIDGRTTGVSWENEPSRAGILHAVSKGFLMKKIAILGGAAIIAALAWTQPAKTQKGGNQKAQDSVGENDQPVVISDGSILFTGVSTLRADAADHTIQLIVPKAGVNGLAFQTVELPGNPNTVTVKRGEVQ